MTVLYVILMALGSDVYTDFYDRGGAAYRSGNYAGAITAYEQLAASGVWNSEVYFNLGNAYYHQGDLGRAVLNYERAAAIDANFAPARRNLAFTISETEHKLERPAGFSLDHRRPSRLPGLPQAYLEWSLVAFWWLLWGILIPRKSRRTIPRSSAVVVWIFVGLCALALSIPAPPTRSAVVIAAEAPLRFGPDPRDAVRIILLPGDRVLVDRVDGAWARVETAAGDRGWLSAGDVALAGPPFSHGLTDRE